MPKISLENKLEDNKNGIKFVVDGVTILKLMVHILEKNKF